MKYRPFITELNAKNEKHDRIRIGEEIDARESYKAIVMPMVGLSFSIFFLITNFLSLISMFLFTNNPKFSRIFMVATLGVLIAIPSLKGGPISEIGAESKRVTANL
ncbi:hypothetical protein HLH17_17595 [Acinetobacter sp. ANC 5380]|uniref:Uncharacterized protein n=1 Tax=Acinetobacter terrae TaxID=2731247 RepID=A0A7Y2RIU1_9GAMM|nr:hypothetical protein [Acinetobacter terrae]NNH79409.1 hypothetical protein [Acinetobacter terrae]